jgi:predicted RND superfamily exporter protein
MKNTTKTDSEPGWANSYASFVIRNRWIVIVMLLMLSIAGSLFIKDLDMRNDPDTLLPPSNRYVATNAYVEQNFGMGNLMVFALRIEEGDIYQPWFINKIQQLHQRLVALPHARNANFIDLAAKKIKYMGADENGLVFKRLIPTAGISDDPELAKQQLAFLKEGLENNPVLSPMLVGMEDAEGNKCAFGEYEQRGCVAKAAYIIGDYSDEVKLDYLPWVREVRSIMAEFEDPRYQLLVAGEPYFLAYMLLDLSNKWWLFAISLVIVLLVLWYEFRNWRGAVFPLLGVSATIVMTLGLMGMSTFKLTTMMVLTPMLLLAIGIGHSVQITRRFLQEQARLGDCEQAAHVAIRRTIVPATLSIVTDMVGFATLATVDISFYQAYAYFGMLGMATLLLTTTTLIPLLMMTFPCPQNALHADDERGWETRMGSFLSTLLAGPGKWLPIGFVALVLIFSSHYTQIGQGDAEDLMPGVEKGIDYSLAAFKADSEIITQLLQLNRIMPGVISVTVPIRGKQPIAPNCLETPFPEFLYEIENRQERLAQCKQLHAERGCWDPDPCGAQGVFNDADVLGDIEKMENWMRAHPSIGFTGSYAQYIRLVNMLLTAEPGVQPKLTDLAIPTKEYLTAIDPDDDRDPTEIVQMFNGLLESMTEEGDMDTFVSKDWNEGVIMGFVNTMNPRETHQVTVDIQHYIEQHKNDPGFAKVNFGLRCKDTACDTGRLAEAGPDYIEPGLGGFLGATEATREVAWENWLKGPLQTALAVFVIAALICRSIMVSIILMVLLLITLFAQYGLGGYFTATQNWSGNLAFHLQVALSISMGLGIDYGIYMMSRLREEMRANASNWEIALRNTLSTTGSAIIISVVVLISCFIPLMNTDLANTWGLGVYITQALMIDVVTALTLLPILVKWLKPRYIRHSAGAYRVS